MSLVQIARSHKGRRQNENGIMGDERSSDELPNSELLTAYIPTETVTLFLAAASISPQLGKIWPEVEQTGIAWILYWAFALLTPVLLAFIAYGGALREKIPFEWPIWGMCASTIAYLAWAFPIVCLGAGEDANLSEKLLPISGFIALVISTFLAFIERNFDLILKPDNG